MVGLEVIWKWNLQLLETIGIGVVWVVGMESTWN